MHARNMLTSINISKSIKDLRALFPVFFKTHAVYGWGNWWQYVYGTTSGRNSCMYLGTIYFQANAARSKTVILVKNLPAKTDVGELEFVFSPFGGLGRVLLPPSGITAIVEFLVPIEAKAAFTKLAYRKVSHFEFIFTLMCGL